jgi:hypothetical protein
MQEFTPEEAVEIVSKLQGPEGLGALGDELQNLISQRHRQIDALHAEIKAFTVVQRTIKVMKKRWGLEPGGATTEAEEIAGAEPQADTVDPETMQRIEDGLCIFKSRETKKWCQRKLLTKKEKECGYCKTHMAELGLSEN